MISLENEAFETIMKEIDFYNAGLFCGAGISFNSGLPLANDLIANILERFDMNKDNIDKIIASSLPFEAIIQYINEEGNIDELLEIFKLGRPNTNHYFIAYLLKNKIIKNVLTTNFDSLIETALTEINLVEGIDFLVYSSDDDFKSINWFDNSIKIVKIHGSVSDLANMAITLESVATIKNYDIKRNVVEFFFNNAIHRNVLIMGYSCSDTFDISPQIANNSNPKSSVVLIEHTLNKETVNVENICFKKNNNPFRDYDGKRIYTNIDALVKFIWNSKFQNEYLITDSTVFWVKNVESWHSKFCSFSNGMKHHLSAKLLYSIGEYPEALNSWYSGLKIAKDENNLIFYYSQLGNIGMSLNSLSRFEEARKNLELSIKSCRVLGNKQGEISQLEALGNVYKNLGEIDKAIVLFKRAIKLSKNDSESLCSSYGNLASLYLQKEDPQNVLKYIRKGYPLATKLGKKQNEGSMLASLGTAFFFKKDYKKAIEYLEKSIEITKQIGDLNGEAISFLNLSNIFLLTGEIKKSYICSNEALRIAQEIGSQHSTIGAYYCIGNTCTFLNQFDLALKNYQSALDISTEVYGIKHQTTIKINHALERLITLSNGD